MKNAQQKLATTPTPIKHEQLIALLERKEGTGLDEKVDGVRSYRVVTPTQ